MTRSPVFTTAQGGSGEGVTKAAEPERPRPCPRRDTGAGGVVMDFGPLPPCSPSTALRPVEGESLLLIHTIFDLLAWVSAFLMGWFVSRRGWITQARTLRGDPGYYIALSLGALAGAFAFGTSNIILSGRFWQIGHSIAGAIAGG